MQRTAQLDDVGGPGFVIGFWDAVPSAANVGYYIGVVAEQSLRRRMLDPASRITELATDLETEVDTALDQAEQTMLAVGQAKPAATSTPSGGCYRRCWNASNASKKKASTWQVSPPALADLNRKVGGLHPAWVTAPWPGTSPSHVAATSGPVAFFSL